MGHAIAQNGLQLMGWLGFTWMLTTRNSRKRMARQWTNWGRPLLLPSQNLHSGSLNRGWDHCQLELWCLQMNRLLQMWGLTWSAAANNYTSYKSTKQRVCSHTHSYNSTIFTRMTIIRAGSSPHPRWQTDK